MGDGFRAEVDGGTLRLSADAGVETGVAASFAVSVRDATQTGRAGRVDLRVVPSTRPLAQPATDEGTVTRGSSTTVDVLANDQAGNPFPGTPLTVASIRGADGASLPAGVTVTPSADRGDPRGRRDRRRRAGRRARAVRGARRHGRRGPGGVRHRRDPRAGPPGARHRPPRHGLRRPRAHGRVRAGRVQRIPDHRIPGARPPRWRRHRDRHLPVHHVHRADARQRPVVRGAGRGAGRQRRGGLGSDVGLRPLVGRAARRPGRPRRPAARRRPARVVGSVGRAVLLEPGHAVRRDGRRRHPAGARRRHGGRGAGSVARRRGARGGERRRAQQRPGAGRIRVARRLDHGHAARRAHRDRHALRGRRPGGRDAGDGLVAGVPGAGRGRDPLPRRRARPRVRARLLRRHRGRDAVVRRPRPRGRRGRRHQPRLHGPRARPARRVRGARRQQPGLHGRRGRPAHARTAPSTPAVTVSLPRGDRGTDGVFRATLADARYRPGSASASAQLLYRVDGQGDGVPIGVGQEITLPRPGVGASIQVRVVEDHGDGRPRSSGWSDAVDVGTAVDARAGDVRFDADATGGTVVSWTSTPPAAGPGWRVAPGGGYARSEWRCGGEGAWTDGSSGAAGSCALPAGAERILEVRVTANSGTLYTYAHRG
ncbi:hypothetical protein [Clavibacter tessellarius]|uniref:hypothetical protein n=1 Tax=Clavibacter tessellarius TaxID=31965 RepID=UPI0032498F8A